VEVVVLAIIVVEVRLTHELSPKVNDDAFVEMHVGGVVVVVNQACLFQLVCAMLGMSSRLIWFSNAPFS
jgi:hypothetical protein